MWGRGTAGSTTPKQTSWNGENFTRENIPYLLSDLVEGDKKFEFIFSVGFDGAISGN